MRANLLRSCCLASWALGCAVPAAAAELQVTIDKLRDGKGNIYLCLTQAAAHFPNCDADPQAVKRSLPAGHVGPITIGGLLPGRYALSVFHDENGNGKFDTLLGIPREGFGFSRNPAIHFGAPKFGEVLFDVGVAITRQTVRMQYLL